MRARKILSLLVSFALTLSLCSGLAYAEPIERIGQIELAAPIGQIELAAQAEPVGTAEINPAATSIEAEFDLVVEVLEWGSATTAVVIDMGVDVDAGAVDADTFSVWATTNDPGNNALIYDGPRTVAKAYVSASNVKGAPAASGRYVVLELKYGFNNTNAEIDGCAAIIYRNGNNWLRQAYTVTQDEPIDGIYAPVSCVPSGAVQRPYLDLFELVENPVEGYASEHYEAYIPEAAGPLPLVLWNHGGGETYNAGSGGNEGAQLFANMGGIGWILNAPEECIVVAPQRGTGAGAPGYSQAGAIAYLKYLVEAGVADGDRLYISGCSMGGQETDQLIAAYPGLWAAAIPTCPAGSVNASSAADIASGGFPVWLIGAADDQTVRASNVDAIAATMAVAGVDVYRTTFEHSTGTEIPNADYTGYYQGHWSWVMVLNNWEDVGPQKRGPIIDWLFAQSRGPLLAEGVTVERDPDGPTGYKATFVYKNEAASRVQLTSDVFTFFDPGNNPWNTPQFSPYEWKDGMFPGSSMGSYLEDMRNVGDGYWMLALPLPNGAYSYRYRVTTGASSANVLDPANMPAVGQGATGQMANFSMVYMPRDEAKQPTLDRTIEVPREDTPKGRVEHITYARSSDGATRPLAVYLPPHYDAGRAEPYKVLYISHGGGGHEQDWMNDAAVPIIMDNMVADGRAEEFIVASMAWNQSQQASRNAELVNDIIPKMEAAYNVSKEASGRAMAGLSAGSTTSANVWMYDAQKDDPLFGYFGLWSSGDTQSFHPDALAPAGTGGTVGIGLSYADMKNLDFAKVMVGVGVQDDAITGRDRFANNTAYYNKLASLGIDVSWYVHNGTHDWMLWPLLFVDFVDDVLWTPKEGVTVERDPDGPTGYKATFVYKDGAAETVRLFGDCMWFGKEDYEPESSRAVGTDGNMYAGELFTPYDWEPGMYPIHVQGNDAALPGNIRNRYDGTKYYTDMAKQGDYWTVSVPLPSGAFKYCYYVDSTLTTNAGGVTYINTGRGTKVLDPANLPLQNPHTGNFANFSIVYMPFDPAKQSAADDRSLELPIGDPAKAGTVVFEQVNGVEVPGIAGTRDLSVGIYLPPGYDDSGATTYKVFYLSHGGGGHERDWTNDGVMPNIMDNMIAQGRVDKDTIVVAVNFGSAAQGGLGSTNALSMAAAQKDYLIPLMESKYHASTKAKDRAYAGLSAGGALSANMMLGTLSDPANYPQYGTWGIWAPMDVPTDNPAYPKTPANDAIRNLSASDIAELNKLNIIVDAGAQDKKHVLTSTALIAACQEMGIDVIRGIYPNGGHDWMCWPRNLVFFLDGLWDGKTYTSDFENQASLTVAPDTFVSGAAAAVSIPFRMSVANLYKASVVSGELAIADGRFDVSVTADYPGATVVYNAANGKFTLFKAGGFADAAEADLMTITLALKAGEALSHGDTIEAILDSISFTYAFGADSGTSPSMIANGAAATKIWMKSEAPGDMNWDGKVDGADLAMALDAYGKRAADADWYSSGAYIADVNGDGVVDMADIMAIAYLSVQ